MGEGQEIACRLICTGPYGLEPGTQVKVPFPLARSTQDKIMKNFSKNRLWFNHLGIKN
jgi:hypothetical protein